VVPGFLKEYFKRFGVLTAALSIACLFLFFSAIIPANAFQTAGTFEYSQKYVGGVHLDMKATSEAYDASVPRNAAGEKLKLVGTFRVTHYCPCTICTFGTGITASGKKVAEGMIAADWKVLPQGTKVYIKHGDALLEKVVEDKGGAINGNVIDVFVPTHSQALAMGVYTADVYVDPETVLP